MKRILGSAAAIVFAAAVLCAPVFGVSAGSACVMDAETGVLLYAKNETQRNLIASTTKIMTGLLICEDCDLHREIAVPPEAVGIEGSSAYLKAGERLCIEELLNGMMLSSGNDCAAALAIAHSGSLDSFVSAMNARACAMGLNQTHFANPHGLDDDRNYSTARDLARLACTAMENETFAEVVGRKRGTCGGRTLVNHNKLLWRYPEADGVKTGYTSAAGRILVSSAVRQGRRIVCVTIRDPDDWNDHCRLLDEGFSRFSETMLCRRGQALGAFPDGQGAVCADDVQALLLPEEHVDRLRVMITAHGAIAQFMCGERVAAECPLIREPMGGIHGGTDPEDHCGPDGTVTPESRGTDACGPGAGQRKHGTAGGSRRPGGGRDRGRRRPSAKARRPRLSDAQ